jgi:hypothetical protein
MANHFKVTVYAFHTSSVFTDKKNAGHGERVLTPVERKGTVPARPADMWLLPDTGLIPAFTSFTPVP